MNVDTISMPPKKALQAYRDYRRAVSVHRRAEGIALMKAYRALGRGVKVIDLVAVMQAANVDALGRPRLAIARADQTQVRFDHRWRGECVFDKPGAFSRGRSATRVRLPLNTFRAPDEKPALHLPQVESLTAIVPTIPPLHRPHDSLEHYWLLWEAEWSKPPVDPALLKHLGLNLYAVLAVWDLTELEQAVLRGRPVES
jgi:hypothetical protein